MTTRIGLVRKFAGLEKRKGMPGGLFTDVTVQPARATVMISTQLVFVDATEMSSKPVPTKITQPCLSCGISAAIFIPAITNLFMVPLQ